MTTTKAVLHLQSLGIFSIGDIITEHSTGKKSFVTNVSELRLGEKNFDHTITTVPLSKYRVIRWFQVKWCRFKYL